MYLGHVVNTSKLAMTMRSIPRLENLRHLLSDLGVFNFDGRPVCAEFLMKEFRLSKDLQCSVKGLPQKHESKASSHISHRSINVVFKGYHGCFHVSYCGPNG